MENTYKELSKLIKEIVNLYAKFDNQSGQYTLSINKIPEVALDPVVAMLMSDEDIAAEATGPDNPEWEKTIQPLMYRSFANGLIDNDIKTEIADAWTHGIRSYMTRYITPHLDNALAELNAERGFVEELAWCPANETAYVKRWQGIHLIQ